MSDALWRKTLAELAGGDLAIHGTRADETIYGGEGDDTIFGRFGDDTLFGLGGNDTLFGGEGDDWLNGGDGSNVLFGGDGNDRLVFQPFEGTNEFYGGAGNDLVEYNSLASDQVVDGGEGRDSLVLGFPVVTGAPINFDLENGFVETVAGVSQISGIESITAFQGNVTITGTDADERFTALGPVSPLFAGVTFDGAGGNDILTGANFADTLIGGSGDDTVYGGQLNDTIFDGQGTDTYFGGASIDVVIFDGAQSDFTVETLGNGTFLVTDLRSGEANVLAGIETLQFDDGFTS